MREVTSPTQVADLLRSFGAKLVAIDGAHGSGKSHLASELGLLLGLGVIHLDDFLEPHLGDYVKNIHLGSVSAALAASGACIVDGVCVLQILDQMGLKADSLVYVKRMTHGIWPDEDHFDPRLPIEEHLAAIRESLRPVAEFLGESGEIGAAEEVIRYHAQYRPHEAANLVFLRNDS